MNAAISGDIVSSTALTIEEKESLFNGLRSLIETVRGFMDSENEPFYGRIIKGDYIECYLKSPVLSLRVALIIKSFVKFQTVDASLSSDKKEKLNRQLFNQFGIRLAIGVGLMQKVDLDNGILDGDAIYLSGRKMDETKSYSSVIRNTMFFDSTDVGLAARFDTMITLIDEIINRCSPKQSEIVYHKLLKKKEAEIAALLGVTQSTVNQHSTAAGWNSIEKAVSHYEQLFIKGVF